jgi:preprotein translocase subunit SecF
MHDAHDALVLFACLLIGICVGLASAILLALYVLVAAPNRYDDQEITSS